MTERPPGAAASRDSAKMGGALAWGLFCSVPAALPALVRVLPGGGAAAAIALVAAVSLVVAPLGVWLRRALADGLPPADRALLAGVALSALPLALFGGVLKSTTHHRPLGGATFAVAALCVLALCIGLSFRILGKSSHGAATSPWQNLFTLGCGLSLACVLLLGSARAARPSLVDFLALSAGVAAAGVAKMPTWLARSRGRGVAARVVLAGWVVLLACAVLSLRSPGESRESRLGRSLTTQAPVSFVTLSWLGDGS